MQELPYGGKVYFRTLHFYSFMICSRYSYLELTNHTGVQDNLNHLNRLVQMEFYVVYLLHLFWLFKTSNQLFVKYLPIMNLKVTSRLGIFIFKNSCLTNSNCRLYKQTNGLWEWLDYWNQRFHILNKNLYN